MKLPGKFSSSWIQPKIKHVVAEFSTELNTAETSADSKEYYLSSVLTNFPLEEPARKLKLSWQSFISCRFYLLPSALWGQINSQLIALSDKVEPAETITSDSIA